LTQTLKNKDAEIAYQSAEIINLEKVIEELTTNKNVAIAALKEELKKLTDSRNLETTKVDRLVQTSKEKSADITVLKIQLEQLNEAIIAKDTEIAVMKERQKRFESEKSAEITDLKNEKEESKKILAAKEARIAELSHLLELFKVQSQLYSQMMAYSSSLPVPAPLPSVASIMTTSPARMQTPSSANTETEAALQSAALLLSSLSEPEQPPKTFKKRKHNSYPIDDSPKSKRPRAEQMHTLPVAHPSELLSPTTVRITRALMPVATPPAEAQLQPVTQSAADLPSIAFLSLQRKFGPSSLPFLGRRLPESSVDGMRQPTSPQGRR
jgi:hypothetical protein